MAQKQVQCDSDVQRCNQETERLKSKIHELEAEEADLKRRLLGAERYKDTLKEAKLKTTKLEFLLDKLADKLEFYKDDLDQCKIDLMAAKNFQVFKKKLSRKFANIKKAGFKKTPRMIMLTKTPIWILVWRCGSPITRVNPSTPHTSTPCHRHTSQK
jgi:predicted RNase H-like nuclease (RuvC/YqgF family)